jgi:DNA-binding transcriptional LysR family regulator
LRFPDVELRLIVSDSYLTLDKKNIDVAIRWGEVEAEGFLVEPLFPGAAIPLCSHDYLTQCTPLKQPGDWKII